MNQTPASEQPASEESPYADLFIEHSNFTWKIWKGDEIGKYQITTRACGKTIGKKHPFRGGSIPAEIEDKLLEANAAQFGITVSNPPS